MEIYCDRHGIKDIFAIWGALCWTWIIWYWSLTYFRMPSKTFSCITLLYMDYFFFDLLTIHQKQCKIKGREQVTVKKDPFTYWSFIFWMILMAFFIAWPTPLIGWVKLFIVDLRAYISICFFYRWPAMITADQRPRHELPQSFSHAWLPPLRPPSFTANGSSITLNRHGKPGKNEESKKNEATPS